MVEQEGRASSCTAGDISNSEVAPCSIGKGLERGVATIAGRGPGGQATSCVVALGEGGTGVNSAAGSCRGHKQSLKYIKAYLSSIIFHRNYKDVFFGFILFRCLNVN
jgi:hypothetical protein